MAKFRSDNQEALLEHSPVPKADQANYREWSKRFAKWRYGTEHIRIQYSVDYDGVDIRKLSGVTPFRWTAEGLRMTALSSDSFRS